MTKRICVIGNAGSGKSTLVTDLFTVLKKQGKNVELVTEFIRTDIQLNGPMRSIWEQYRTRTNQQELEDAVPSSVEYAVIDSGTLTPLFYSALYADKTDPRQRLVLQDMMRYFINDIYNKRYDYVLYLPSSQTYEANANILADGTRYQSTSEIAQLEAHMNLYFTQVYKLDNVYCLNAPLAERINEAIKIISS